MKIKNLLLLFLAFPPLWSQAKLVHDDTSVSVYLKPSREGICVEGMNGSYLSEDVKIKNENQYYYSVEPLGSAGHLVYIWEFTRVVSLGDYGTRYWVARATSFHLVDIKGGYFDRADADCMFRFNGDVSQHKDGKVATVELYGIKGLFGEKSAKKLIFKLRRLEIKNP